MSDFPDPAQSPLGPSTRGLRSRVVFASVGCVVLVVGSLSLFLAQVRASDGTRLPPLWVVGLLVALAAVDLVLNAATKRKPADTASNPRLAMVSAGQQVQLRLLLGLVMCNSTLLVAGVLAFRLDRPTTFLLGVVTSLAGLLPALPRPGARGPRSAVEAEPEARVEAL